MISRGGLIAIVLRVAPFGCPSTTSSSPGGLLAISALVVGLSVQMPRASFVEILPEWCLWYTRCTTLSMSTPVTIYVPVLNAAADNQIPTIWELSGVGCRHDLVCAGG